MMRWFSCNIFKLARVMSLFVSNRSAFRSDDVSGSSGIGSRVDFLLSLESFVVFLMFFFEIMSQKVLLLCFLLVSLLLVLVEGEVSSDFVLVVAQRNHSTISAMVPLHGFPCSPGYGETDGWTERMVGIQFLKLCN